MSTTKDLDEKVVFVMGGGDIGRAAARALTEHDVRVNWPMAGGGNDELKGRFGEAPN